MILSQAHILRCLAAGEIQINPFDRTNLKEGSYTFTIDEEYFEQVELPRVIDLRKEQPKLALRKMDQDGIELQPQSFLLCRTKELLVLEGPYSCFLSTRGSCAQVGLNVLQSSQYAEQGTAQKLLLEISNMGKRPVIIFPGMKVMKAIFVPMFASEIPKLVSLRNDPTEALTKTRRIKSIRNEKRA